MSMKKKKKSRQETLWIPHDAVASSPGHPFYEELERVLREEEFDSFVESKCSPYYAKKQGRPSIPPGVYFRMLLIGYFERIDSERGICWRCSDSLSLRQFLGLGMEERTPDHSSLSRIRNRLPLEVHESVFGWVLEVLASRGMIDGKTLGVDATTLEANAALRSIVRRDTGESYESYLKELARKSGIEEPSRADIAKLDKKRPKKGSNKEWVNPNEPDAEIMKMKSGGTDMAHKAEHAVDMSGEGAVRPMDCSGAKRAPMVETKRNKAAIRLALSSAYSFGVALPMRLRIRIPRLNPATCVRRRLSIFSLCWDFPPRQLGSLTQVDAS